MPPRCPGAIHPRPASAKQPLRFPCSCRDLYAQNTEFKVPGLIVQNLVFRVSLDYSGKVRPRRPPAHTLLPAHCRELVLLPLTGARRLKGR